MKYFLKIILHSCLIYITIFIIDCGRGDDGQPLLSYLLNSRMTLVLKGTYATDNPLSFSEINNNQIFTDPDDTLHLADVPAYDNLPIYLDIGEIRLSTRNPFDPLITIKNNDDAVKFWDVLTDKRQVYCSTLYSFDLTMDSCRRTGGLVNFSEFMNGNGAFYPSRDVGSGVYLHAGVFIRAIATGYARDDDSPLFDRFDSNDIFGSNIIQNVNYDPGIDTAEKQARVPQFFPLHHVIVLHQQPSMVVDESFTPLVLEIRFNMKENLMLHSFLNASSRVQTIVGFSDWRKNHESEFDMGGSVLTRARIFYPEFANDLVITGGTENKPVRHYLAIYLYGEDNRDDNLPLAATPVRNGENKLRNIMPGPYYLQCRYDCIYDGYPELIVKQLIMEMPGQLGNDHTVDFTCGDTVPADAGCN